MSSRTRPPKPIWPDPLAAAIYADWERQRTRNYRRRHALVTKVNHAGFAGPDTHPVHAVEAARGELVWSRWRGWLYVAVSGERAA